MNNPRACNSGQSVTNGALSSTPVPPPLPVAVDTAEYGRTSRSFSIPHLSSIDYHSARDYLSSTGVRELLKSPAHYHAWLNAPPSTATAAQRIGTTLHAALLEPEIFSRDYACFSGARRGQKWLEFRDAMIGKEVLTDTEMAQVVGMRDAVLAFEPVDLGRYIQDGSCEQSIFWTDDSSGERCRIRCDVHHRDVIVDFKTTTDARPSCFYKQAQQNGYPTQAAFYRRGVEAFTGEGKDFWLIAVETTAPHGVWLHELARELIASCDRQIEQGLAQLRQARLTNTWRSYANPWTVMELQPSRRR